MTYLFPISDKALDEYASLRNKVTESNEDAANIDPRLEAIVEKMLEKYVFIFFSITSTSFDYCS